MSLDAILAELAEWRRLVENLIAEQTCAIT
jgi:hypothetical protein